MLKKIILLIKTFWILEYGILKSRQLKIIKESKLIVFSYQFECTEKLRFTNANPSWQSKGIACTNMHQLVS